MSDLKTSVIVDLAGNLPRQAPRFAQAMNRFGDSSNRTLRVMRGSVAAVGRGLDRLANRYTALLSGVGVAAAIRDVIDFDAAMTRMGTNALLSAEKVAQIKQQIQSVANAADVRIDRDVLATSVSKLFELTGDPDFVVSQIRNMGVALQGYGAEANSAAELIAQFWEKGIRAPDEVMAQLDRLFFQFAQAKIPVGDVARVAPELFSIITSQGPEAVTQMGALAQIYAKTTGTVEKSVTALRATFAVFNDPEKFKAIDAAFAEAGLQPIKKSNGELRDVHQLLIDIVNLSGKNEQVLFKLFGREEALVGLKSLLSDENQKKLQEMVQAQIKHGMTLDASRKNAQTAKSALQSLSNAGKEFANTKLSEPIKDLVGWMDKLKPEEIQEFFDKALTGAKVLGGVVLGLKALSLIGGAVRGVRDIRGGSLSGAAGAVGGVTPVYVVNMPGAGGGFGGGYGGGYGGDIGGDGKRRKGGRAPGRGSRRRLKVGRFSMPWFGRQAPLSNPSGSYFSGYGAPQTTAQRFASYGRNAGGKVLNYGGKALRVAGKAAAPLAALGGAINIANIATDDNLTTRQKLDEGTQVLGGTAGAIAGAQVGAMVGSVVPIVGTAIGGLIGGAVGYFAGDSIGDWLGDFFTDGEDKQTEVLSKSVDKAFKSAPNLKVDPLTGELRIVVEGPASVRSMKVSNPNIDFIAEHRLGPNMGLSG